jgi:uncharacterized membrane protein YobD (UPF0266 family)
MGSLTYIIINNLCFNTIYRRYRHNVSTLATDGLFIIQIAKPSLAIAPHRLYVETVLAATPTRKRPRDAKVKLQKSIEVQSNILVYLANILIKNCFSKENCFCSFLRVILAHNLIVFVFINKDVNLI